MKKRRKIIGTKERPRFSVYKANRHIYAQVINDQDGRTLVSASSLVRAVHELPQRKMEGAKRVGAEIAKKAKNKGIVKVVFDRGKFQYHGRIKALAEAARQGGLDF